MSFRKQYRDLETKVLHALRNKVMESERVSKYVGEKAISVHCSCQWDYEELAIINDRLTFIDNHGLQYDVFADCSLEDLIDILEPKI